MALGKPVWDVGKANRIRSAEASRLSSKTSLVISPRFVQGSGQVKQRQQRLEMERTRLYAQCYLTLQEEMTKHHFDTIAELKLEIAELDEQIATDSIISLPPEKERFQYHRNRQWAMDRRCEDRKNAVELLKLLQEGWPKIGLVLRNESRKLFTLPRERMFPRSKAAASQAHTNPHLRLVRDMIYSFLYTSRRNVVVYYKRDLGPGPVFPRDRYLYTNPSVVDPVIASEAIRVLFSTNTLEVVAQSGTRVGNPARTAMLRTLFNKYNNPKLTIAGR